MPITKPLLASPVKDEQIRYPVIASPKLDGIRCLKIKGQMVSRMFKPIQNEYIRKDLKKYVPEGADGEIMSGSTFQECSGNVMRRDGEPVYTYYWFDWVFRGKLDEPYNMRIARMMEWREKHPEYFQGAHPKVRIVPTQWVMNEESLARYEARCLEDGYEGVMIRSPEGHYKCGRSRVSDHILLKIKRFADSEGIVTGFVEMMHNENEAEQDAFGRTKRSTSKDGKVPAGTLGKLLVTDDKFPDHLIELGTGQGLTHELRQEIWDHRDAYLGRLAKYKYQEQGMKDKPRFPIFLGFRHEDDTGNE